MKLALDVKKQPCRIKHKDTGVIISAGSNAWTHAKRWQEHDVCITGDNESPVVLVGGQLKEIGNLQIVLDGRTSVCVFRVGQLDPVMVKAIGRKPAAASIQNANYYPDSMYNQKCESWREYLVRKHKNTNGGLITRFSVEKKTEDSATPLALNQMGASQRGEILLAHYGGELVASADSDTVHHHSGVVWGPVQNKELQ